MLKSFILIPSSDILSYSNEKEYPFNIFPTVVLIYNKRNIVKLDERELSLLYHSGYNESDKNITINFECIKNPIQIITEENKNGERLKNIKLQNIKHLLPFSLDINNIIVSSIRNENLNWKIKSNRICHKNPFSFYKYRITNELNITFKNIKQNIKPLAYNVSINKIIYGTFTLNSYIPVKINVIYFNKNNKNNKNSNIKINNNYITKILIFTNKQPLTKYITLSDDEHFFTEDNDPEQLYLNDLYTNLTI